MISEQLRDGEQPAKRYPTERQRAFPERLEGSVAARPLAMRQFDRPADLSALPYALARRDDTGGGGLRCTDSAGDRSRGRSHALEIPAHHCRPAATPVTIKIDRAIEGLGLGTMVWEPEYANPDTALRRCRIEKSCRLQTPVKLEACDMTAFLWFYGERVVGLPLWSGRRQTLAGNGASSTDV